MKGKTTAFNVRAGHLIVPMGLTNAHHEPINFFGTSRPEGETTIIPSTWHETDVYKRQLLSCFQEVFPLRRQLWKCLVEAA